MTIVDRLLKEHDRFRKSLERLDKEVLDSTDKYREGWTREAGAKALEILRDLMPRLERHEHIEHTLLYPEMLRHAPETRLVLDAMEDQHRELRRLVEGFLRELPQAGEHPTGWILANVCDLSNLLEKHMWKEEDELLELAKRRVPPRELERLEKEAEAIKAPE
jgi:hemerythrin-like domain-containing protein